MNISKKIYQLRTSKGLTQVELARIAGVSDKAVSAWEAEKREPKLKAIQGICDYFHLDLATFIDEQSDELTSGEAKRQPTVTGELSDSEKRMLELFRRLSPEAQEAFPALLEAMLKAQGLL